MSSTRYASLNRNAAQRALPSSLARRAPWVLLLSACGCAGAPELDRLEEASMVLEAAAVQRADGTLRPEDLKNRDVREAVLTRLNAAGLSELDAPELHAQLNRHTAIEEIDADYLSDDTYVAYADTYLLDGTGRVVWAQASINGDMIEVLDNPDLEQLSDSIDGDRWAQGLLVVSGRGGLTLDYGLDQVGAGLPLDRAIEIISSELERGVSVSYAVSATDFTHDSWPKWEF